MRDTLVLLVIRHQQIGRFLVTGAIAFTVNISVLYASTSELHIYYLLSTVFAFIASFSVSFVMQKFWTFKIQSRDQWLVQFYRYLVLQLVNLALNACLLYIFVEYLHIWYILSQTIILIGLASISFFVNKVYIFRPETALP